MNTGLKKSPHDVAHGLHNARAHGTQLGRPRRIVNRDELVRLRGEGTRIQRIAEKLGVGYGTVRLRLRNVNPI
jgi:DNA-binding NarL/FixJ family response regulator